MSRKPVLPDRLARVRHMTKGLIVYFSQTGSTARAVERIATGLRASGFEVRACNIKDQKPPDVHGYDVLGIGFPVYAFKPPLNVCDHVSRLPDLEGRPAFVFLTHGTHRFNAADSIRRELVRKKAKEWATSTAVALTSTSSI